MVPPPDGMVKETDVEETDVSKLGGDISVTKLGGDDSVTSASPVVMERRKRNLSWKAREGLDAKSDSKCQEKRVNDSIKEDQEEVVKVSDERIVVGENSVGSAEQNGENSVGSAEQNDEDDVEIFCKCKKPAE